MNEDLHELLWDCQHEAQRLAHAMPGDDGKGFQVFANAFCDARVALKGTADRIEALEAENARLRSSREWQPIETAPKDEDIIVAVMAAGHEPSIGEARFWSDGGTWEPDWWWQGTTPKDYYVGPISEMNFGTPTHWMRKPEAPALTNQTEKGE